ncbi:MAG: hypothetical protein SGJ10_11550 [Bacteroidota bacterium]|nr:hypothetical protein [Bacteroidota bacterium]
MNIEPIKESIAKRDVASFVKEWALIKDTLSDEARQELLAEIVEFYYKEKYYSSYKRIFDLILYKQLSLDFNIDSCPCTFLCAVFDKASIQLMDYFLGKGANLNYIGDSDPDAKEGEYDDEAAGYLRQRHVTCLDFA